MESWLLHHSPARAVLQLPLLLSGLLLPLLLLVSSSTSSPAHHDDFATVVPASHLVQDDMADSVVTSTAGAHSAAAPRQGARSTPSASLTAQPPASTAKRCRPNIILVLTDDQDAVYDTTSPRFMPQLHKHVIKKGVRFSNFHVNTPVCCPSRVSLLTGRYTHNTNLTDVIPPYGGYTYFRQASMDQSYLPTWLESAGYTTYYTGKFLVEYTLMNRSPGPAGWTDIDALVMPWTFQYLSPAFSRNGGDPVMYPGKYTTDVQASKAVAQLKTAAAAAKTGTPFFMEIAPVAPHDTATYKPAPPGKINPYAFELSPPVPAPRHATLYKDINLPKRPNFNEADVSDKPAWVAALPEIVGSNLTYLDEYYRLRLRSLRAVDDMVGQLVDTLEAENLLDDTYIIYTSDNGFHIGAHRMMAGKCSGYEDDIKVPFFIKGPGLKPGAVSRGYASPVDLAATLVALANGDAAAVDAITPAIDGQPLPLQEVAEPGWNFAAPKAKYESVGIEYWSDLLDQLRCEFIFNFTWKGVKPDFGKGRLFKYTVLCYGNITGDVSGTQHNGERELYDLQHDPYELDNLAAAGTISTYYSKEILAKVMQRLDAFLSAWYTCQGPQQCVNPLGRVLPGLTSLGQALLPKYDKFFAAVPKFAFKQCKRYVDWQNEVGGFDAKLKPPQPPSLASSAKVKSSDDQLRLQGTDGGLITHTSAAPGGVDTEVSSAEPPTSTAAAEQHPISSTTDSVSSAPMILPACSREEPSSSSSSVTTTGTTGRHLAVLSRSATVNTDDETIAAHKNVMSDDPAELVTYVTQIEEFGVKVPDEEQLELSRRLEHSFKFARHEVAHFR